MLINKTDLIHSSNITKHTIIYLYQKKKVQKYILAFIFWIKWIKFLTTTIIPIRITIIIIPLKNLNKRNQNFKNKKKWKLPEKKRNHI